MFILVGGLIAALNPAALAAERPFALKWYCPSRLVELVRDKALQAYEQGERRRVKAVRDWLVGEMERGTPEVQVVFLDVTLGTRRSYVFTLKHLRATFSTVPKSTDYPGDYNVVIEGKLIRFDTIYRPLNLVALADSTTERLRKWIASVAEELSVGWRFPKRSRRYIARTFEEFLNGQFSVEMKFLALAAPTQAAAVGQSLRELVDQVGLELLSAALPPSDFETINRCIRTGTQEASVQDRPVQSVSHH